MCVIQNRRSEKEKIMIAFKSVDEEGFPKPALWSPVRETIEKGGY